MTWYFSRKEQVAVAVLLVAIFAAVVVLGIGYAKRSGRRAVSFTPAETAVETVTPTVTPTAASAEQSLVVHVAGAVKRPDVYTFPPGARINDAIRQAGGARADGYADALNRAEKLQDGAKIYVPTKAEWEKYTAERTELPLVEGGGAPAKTAADMQAATGVKAPPAAKTMPQSERKPLPSGKVNLNTATKAQLMTLPGVGEVTAENILSYRAEHGKFTDLAQLLNVPRIGAKTLERLTPYLTL